MHLGSYINLPQDYYYGTNSHLTHLNNKVSYPTSIQALRKTSLTQNADDSKNRKLHVAELIQSVFVCLCVIDCVCVCVPYSMFVCLHASALTV